ncbi:hypothetical protein [Lutibacter sp.]|nr:hypothetical protein [Lutibacter sp.]
MKSNYSKIGAGIALGIGVGVALNNIGLGVAFAIIFSTAFTQIPKKI